MDFKQKFVKSLRVPDRPFSAAGVGLDRRKLRRDAELIKKIQQMSRNDQSLSPTSANPMSNGDRYAGVVAQSLDVK